jgi:hypothetical protein
MSHAEDEREGLALARARDDGRDCRAPSGRPRRAAVAEAPERGKILEIKKVEDLEGAFQAARGWRAQGLNVLASPLLNGLRRTIIELAAHYRLPAVHQWPESVRDGGLMAYGPTQTVL